MVTSHSTIFLLIGLVLFSFPITTYAQEGSISVLEHDVSYDIENGEVIDVDIDVDFVELIVDFVALDDGLIEITIPRGLLDAKLGENEDDIFFVIVDGFETEYIEIESSSGTRTIVVPFFEGDEQVEIIGTDVLLEIDMDDEPPVSEITIPSWIKTNAEWWADNQIDDATFVSGIQYLITNGIMNIPATESGASTGEAIPGWIKTNAEWWADGQIDDETFVSGIQYLITKGIMTI